MDLRLGDRWSLSTNHGLAEDKALKDAADSVIASGDEGLQWLEQDLEQRELVMKTKPGFDPGDDIEIAQRSVSGPQRTHMGERPVARRFVAGCVGLPPTACHPQQ
eukprot:2549327-Amphidinium_carterae.3